MSLQGQFRVWLRAHLAGIDIGAGAVPVLESDATEEACFVLGDAQPPAQSRIGTVITVGVEYRVPPTLGENLVKVNTELLKQMRLGTPEIDGVRIVDFAVTSLTFPGLDKNGTGKLSAAVTRQTLDRVAFAARLTTRPSIRTTLET